MNTVSSLIFRFCEAPRSVDQSLQAISLLSCFGLVVSLGLVRVGFDLGSAWL